MSGFAPLFRKDMVNIHFIVEEGLSLDRLAGTEVAAAIAHEKRVQALVGRTVARAQREQPVGLEAGLLDRDRLHRFSAHHGGDLGKISREATFDRTAVEFTQHATPVPAPHLLPRPLSLAIIAEVHEHCGQWHKLCAGRKGTRLKDLLTVEEASSTHE